jgi:hypothetical protein
LETTLEPGDLAALSPAEREAWIEEHLLNSHAEWEAIYHATKRIPEGEDAERTSRLLPRPRNSMLTVEFNEQGRPVRAYRHPPRPPARPSVHADLYDRARLANRATTGRAPRSRRVSRSASSRDGPASSSDDDLDPPGLTALQRALSSLQDALEHARHDRRAFAAFIDLLAAFAARLNAEQLDNEERSS